MNARDPDATINTGSGHEVRAWRLSHDHENEAQLCIWSQARQEKDEAILAKKREPKLSSWSKTELWQVVDVKPMPVFGKFYNG